MGEIFVGSIENFFIPRLEQMIPIKETVGMQVRNKESLGRGKMSVSIRGCIDPAQTSLDDFYRVKGETFLPWLKFNEITQ